MNSKKISRQTVIIVSIIFIFNVVAQFLINWVQGYQPKTYQIPTNGLAMLLNYLGDYWVNYAVTGVVYLLLWFVYVSLWLGAFLWLWQKITWSRFQSGLLKGRVHLYAALLLILTIPLNQFGFDRWYCCLHTLFSICHENEIFDLPDCRWSRQFWVEL
ncbi:hypothetical protein [Leuconostoc pseudomesenteroides]|uniref:hypothetical protein n=1 Tax=Leuconostoc pseudomesenteroides TaxID=33968 RepID=UPI0021A9AB64|nr:hypothetical protein [Leuconostoc pseudomesenteroides]